MQSDIPLSRALQSWRVTPKSSATFRTEVWARIEAARRNGGESWSAYLRMHFATWCLVAVVALGASSWMGFSAAQAKDESTRRQLVAAYVSQIDPRAHVRP